MLILDWTDKTKHPGLKETDRLLGVLYHAGIADLSTLSAITGWKVEKVQWTIQQVRKIGAQKAGNDPKRKKEERDKWIRRQQRTRHGPYYFSLGMKGFTYVLELLGEKVGKRRPPEAQVDHLMGVNSVLVRLLNRNIRPIWYSTREATSWLYQGLKERSIHYDPVNDRYQVHTTRSPFAVNPDAMVQLPNGRSFYIEYETGANHGAKLQDKILQYIDLQLQLNLKIDPILWVTPSHNVSKLKKAWTKVQETMWEKGYPRDFPYAEMIIIEEGAETDRMLEPSTTIERDLPADTPQPDPGASTVFVSTGDREDLEQLERKIKQLEKELAKWKKKVDFWVRKSGELQRHIDIQQEWIQAVNRWISEKMLLRKGYQAFLEKHPIPKQDEKEGDEK